MDTNLRELERRFRASGDPADEADWQLVRVRAGDLQRERLEAAAYLGHSVARLAVGAPMDFGPADARCRILDWDRFDGPSVGGFESKMHDFGRAYDLDLVVRAALAAVQFTYGVWLTLPLSDERRQCSRCGGTGIDPRPTRPHCFPCHGNGQQRSQPIVETLNAVDEWLRTPSPPKAEDDKVEAMLLLGAMTASPRNENNRWWGDFSRLTSAGTDRGQSFALIMTSAAYVVRSETALLDAVAKDPAWL